VNPELAKQWHPGKNGTLSPRDVTARSGRKVWWKCPRGDDHEWPAVIANRAKGIGCPICSNKRVARSNSLGSARPELAKDWHPSKNGALTPFDVLPSTNRKIWWQCEKNPTHEWEARLNNRYNGKGCPICSNQKIVRDNSLGATNPTLAEQWHPTRNGKLTPFDVAPSTSRKVWWKCPKGDDHEWEATINSRATGTGCPKCNPVWSIPELRIFSELKTIFPTIQHRAILNRQEVDIYIPELKVGIEYDGVYWHHDKLEKDKNKNARLSSSLLLIRIREQGLPLVSANDISVKKISVSTIKKILRVILENIALSTAAINRVHDYLEQKDWIASKLFDKLYSERKTTVLEESLLHLHPKLAREWHPTKNETLRPEHFTPGAGRSVWWLGKCGHEWEDTINHRTGGRDCPQCRYKKASASQKKNRKRGQMSLFD
jgi:very-short-patch-repair endonuclease